MTDTIAAEATPRGAGGLGVVRISGPEALVIAETMVGQTLMPRQAHFVRWKDQAGQQIDEGIALYFKAPNSFTGEDVIEFQCHGSPVVIDELLEVILSAGARMARPGEFSERAFLNDKIDLVQAEAIADLIDSGTRSAAHAALRSLTGEFSNKIQHLVDSLIQLRVFIEATLDFPEEEVDFIQDHKVIQKLTAILEECAHLQASAKQGVLLQEGINLVIVGRPNVGKSSLLNAFTARDTAIVSDIPGTTRDIVKERVNIGGVPVHILDTAGLRETNDVVEQEGVRRSKKALEQADLLIILADVRGQADIPAFFKAHCLDSCRSGNDKILLLLNKIDLTGESPEVMRMMLAGTAVPVVKVSIKTGQGLDLLKATLLTELGWKESAEGQFSARRRHLDALQKAQHALNQGLAFYAENNSLELLAEECRLAQAHLSEITGEFRSDDLLGAIFSTFCIGK